MAKEEKLNIQGQAGKLELLLAGSNSDKVIIICHPHPLYRGSMHNKVVTTVSKTFLELDFTTVRFNFRGVCKSEGEYGNIHGELEDCKSVIDWVEDKYPSAKLWLSGFSFGAYIAAKTTEYLNNYNQDEFGKNKIEQLISLAPSVERSNYHDLKIDIPWLVVQPDKDEIVSATAVYDFIKDVNLENIKLKKFEESSHFFHGKLVDLKQFLFDYYK